MNASIRVLIIAEISANLPILEKELRCAGPEVILQRIETEAELTNLTDPLPDVVLSAYRLPTLDARRALALVRKRDADLPFILISGPIGEAAIVTLFREGLTDVVAEDRPEEVAEAVRRAVEARQGQDIERQARHLQGRDAQLLANVRDSVIVTDLEGIVTFWNEGATRILGWQPEERIGRPLIERFPEEARPFIQRTLGQLAVGEAWNAEFEDYRKDGSRIWLHCRVVPVTDERGEPIGLLGISNDISEIKRAEAAERDLQRFLQSTLDALRSSIAVLDADGRILAVNRNWRRFYEENGGTARTCGVGANYFAVCESATGIYAEESADILQAFRDILAGTLDQYRREYPCQSPTESRWYEVNVNRFEGEGPARIIVAHEDITQRKRAEMEREAARDELRHAMGQANCLLWRATVEEAFPSEPTEHVFDPARGTVLRWDLQVINASEEDAPPWLPLHREQGVPMSRAIQLSRHPDDEIAAGKVATGALLHGEPRYSQTFRNRVEDGSYRFLFEDVRITPRTSETDPARWGPDGKPLRTWELVGVITDITDRRRAEEALKVSEERLMDIAGRANCLLWRAKVYEVDVGPDAERRRLDSEAETILYWDLAIVNEPATLNWLPIDRQEGESVTEAWCRARPQEDWARADEVSWECLRTGGDRYTQTLRVETADGIRYLNEDVRVEPDTPDEGRRVWKLTGVVTDISERVRVEEALRASEERFRSTLDHLIEGCQIIGPDWKYIYVNETAAVHGRRPAYELVGRTMMEVFPGIENSLMFRSLQRCMEDRVAEQLENEFFHEDGTSSWFQLVVQPVPEGLFILSEDITERKRAERTLQQARNELETRVAQRTRDLTAAMKEAEAANQAKSEFLSRISHELRTPLNAILGFGQVLERQELTPRQRESVDYILSGGRLLLDLVNEILDIVDIEARRVGLTTEPVSIRECLLSALRELRPQMAERGITLVDEIGNDTGGQILADRHRLQQVFHHLLSNAVKYNRPNGSITVSVTVRPNRCLRISVRDTGPGIPPESLPKLFTPFERLDAPRFGIEGTGLGLVLSRTLVRAMGGILDVSSVPGQGSTFFVELPATTNTTPSPVPIGPATPVGGVLSERDPSATAEHTLLCIEDRLSNLYLLEAILEMRPAVRLISAMNGHDGLDLARQHDPDLILLDLNLPDISGQEVLSRLRQSALTRDIPVVIISADATETRIRRLLGSGVEAYLTKPVDVVRFLQTIDAILERKTAGQEPQDEAPGLSGRANEEDGGC
ncbi:MAG: PAS domain S-box protein [Capsulimonadales bacterium]|nr:PAS domain S-box protein [Capsulimonadales bacterium]